MSKKSLASLLKLNPVLPPGYTLPIRKKTKDTNRAHGIPFFQDETHIKPTLRLYRHLLRLTSPTSSTTCQGFSKDDKDILRSSMRDNWRKHRHLTSIPRVRNFLESSLELRNYLITSTTESRKILEDIIERHRAKLSHIAARNAKAVKTQPRPRLTGGFLRPTLFNPPLPRLKPQPIEISMMIHHRLRARENRIKNWRAWSERAKDMKMEMAFYRNLYSNTLDSNVTSTSSHEGTKESEAGSRPGVGARKAREIRKVRINDSNSEFIGGWDTEFDKLLTTYQEQFQRENVRSQEKFSVNLVERVDSVKRRKDEYKRQRAEKRKENLVQHGSAEALGVDALS